MGAPAKGASEGGELPHGTCLASIHGLASHNTKSLKHLAQQGSRSLSVPRKFEGTRNEHQYNRSRNKEKTKSTDMADIAMTSHIKKEAGVKTLPDLRGTGYECKLICDQPNGWQGQMAKLRSWHFDKIRVIRSKKASANLRLKIRYGGAPSKLLCEIADLFLQEGIDVSLEKVWPAFDKEIWLELPSHQSTRKLAAAIELFMKMPRILH